MTKGEDIKQRPDKKGKEKERRRKGGGMEWNGMERGGAQSARRRLQFRRGGRNSNQATKGHPESGFQNRNSNMKKILFWQTQGQINIEKNR